MTALDMKIDYKHVTERKNRDGTMRYYFRRRGQPVVRLPGEPLSQEFNEAYRRALSWTKPKTLAHEGSFAWLCDEYMDTTDFKSKALATRNARRRVIVTMMREPLVPGHPENFGQERANLITKRHIEILRDRKAGNPNAGNERLKILSQVFKLGVSRGWVGVNFIRDVERLKVPRGGHETATDEDIAKYLAKHTKGAAWLAMIMLKELGVRVSDLRILGRQHRRNGCLVFKTVKTGVECELTISTELDAVLPKNGKELTFLLNEYGKPFGSDKSLSQSISKWFSQAGIEGVSAHGVRKWRATKMAENGATEYQLMSWFGWRDPKEARPYVQKASRRNLAREAGEIMARSALHNDKKNG